MSYGNRIFTTFERPAPELIEAFRDLPVANIADNMNRMCCMDELYPAAPNQKLLGTAITVRAPGGDNLMFHKAMDLAQPGDIIVFSSVTPSSRSIMGALGSGMANGKGIAGFVIDGFIRDLDEIREMGFPVYSRGVNANGPFKNGPGEVNVPVAIGGQVIFPGDIIVGDGDSVCVIRPEFAEEIAKKATALCELEVQKAKTIAETGYLQRPWVDVVLAEKKTEII